MSDEILAIVRERLGGISKAELLIELRKIQPGVQPIQVEREVKAELDAGRLVAADGRLFVIPATQIGSQVPGGEEAKSLRIVAFDVESIVRLTSEPPDFKEARIFQISAIRFGHDKAWCHANRALDAYVDLPGEGWEIRSAEALENWERNRRPVVEVLEEFRTFVSEADVLVAYNGTGVDFPMLEDALRREDLPPLDRIRYVDAYYLALALWPTPPRQHRLRDLAERVGAKVTRLQWHNALDDSIMLSRLLFAGSRQLRAMPDEVHELLRSAVSDSDAWDLLFDLANLNPAEHPWDDADVASVVGRLLAMRDPRRPTTGSGRARVELQIPGRLVMDGRVSPYELALAAGRRGEERPAQREMTDALRRWIDGRTSGLVEAPTGTGKSYAMLANAIEWLNGGPERKVIIATYTKQLQAQMAADIQALSGAIPGLAAVSDMVKGKANRLSLRALVTALSDCTFSRDIQRRTRRIPYSRDVQFRELVAYLLLRLAAPATLAEEWEGRSVDSPDIPAFFNDYCRRRLHLYLGSLSQAAAGDYALGSGPLAEHTDDVAEAISNHRLIIANHALLLASFDDLESFSEELLLFVDEAHMLEDAATNSMTSTLEYGTVEQLTAEVERWLVDAPRHSLLTNIADANQDLERFLDTEQFPRSAMACFDSAPGDVGSRTIPIASPRGGPLGLRNAASLVAMIRSVQNRLRTLERLLASYDSSGALRAADHFAVERFRGVFSKVSTAQQAASVIVTDAQAVIGPPAHGEPDDGGAGETLTEMPVEDGSIDDEVQETENHDIAQATTPEFETLELIDSHDGEEEDRGDLPRIPSPNRVVWAAESGPSDLAIGNRRYRFAVSSSPVSLPAETRWTEFLNAVPRTYFISATLTVAGTWSYIRRRLGLSEDQVAAVALDSPFDVGSQARLFCLADFPSWAEQGQLAVRSVAWQLGGYVREVVTRDENVGLDSWEHGAIVLTTSRQATADISLEIEQLLARRSFHPPVHVTTMVGNARAVDNFKSGGGVLVGTRGLWQGVDIDDPVRLSLVWINKLPFAPFADPVIAARRALAVEDAERSGAVDPEQSATEDYYLPLAAIALRQAVGRLIRSHTHRGIVIISDPKLSGPTRLRQAYRRIFLGSLDPGLLRSDPDTGERGGGNVLSMTESWRQIWAFLGQTGLIPRARASLLSQDDELRTQTLTPEIREILALALSEEEERRLSREGALHDELIERCSKIGGLLRGDSEPLTLKEKQIEAIGAVAEGKDVLAILPTGYGKSFAFQLPALVLPGVTIVVSPLVSLMQSQALELNRSIGGAVRALVAPLSESNSRLGKAEVADALTGRERHGIRLVYLSPERLCTRQFQELISRGVELGIVKRIAIDEAHTSVQWGDDFRPSFRRFELFLAGLRVRHPELAVTALTATANQTVIEGLRTGIFGLDRTVSGAEPHFHFVTGNPIRPELAVYRRTLGKNEGGPVTVAGLVEAVVATLEDHAIFYCLTVKEVDALWAQLRDVLGADGAGRVRRYHGRLNEAEKAAVVNDFVDAPRKGEDDFSPMIVVATSAFGLGIDRPDIRCVFVVSPPTDLSALYQQLGRAGRDCSARPVDPAGPSNVTMALGTGRGFNLIRWMTRQEQPISLFVRLAEAVLALGTDPTRREHVTVDTEDLAREHIAIDFDVGRLSESESRSARTDDAYRVSVTRVVSMLANLGSIEDLGDYPDRVKILAGDVQSTDSAIRNVVAATLALDPLALKRVTLEDLHQHLVRDISGYEVEIGEPGGTWAMLVDMHALGYLDVSQAPKRSMLTGLVLLPAADGRVRSIPAGFTEGFRERASRSDRELKELRDWYVGQDCANLGLARYFQVSNVPEDVCAHGVSRCSTCWGGREVAELGESIPPVLRAFRLPRPRPASSTASGRPAFERGLDGHVESLLWDNRRGLTAGLIQLVLRGLDSVYDARRHRRKPLWPNLLYSRHRGAAPGVSMADVEASLERLSDRQLATLEGDRWRLLSYAEADARRSAAEQPA